jgi:hypothetical protein
LTGKFPEAKTIIAGVHFIYGERKLGNLLRTSEITVVNKASFDI